MSTLLPLRYYRPDAFPDDYRHACELWQRALAALPGSVIQRSYASGFTVADGTPLECQAAWLGSSQASSLLVVIGGVHGVEGFAGTAVQCDLLHLMEREVVVVPERTAVLLVHALNPWGYHHCRRCDAEGVDINRNFVDFRRPLPANPGYERIRPALGIADPEQRQQVLDPLWASMDEREREVALTGGQYTDPGGPFYGGDRETFSRRVVEDVIERHRLAGRRLAVVDVHTGLGPFGHGEVICDHDPGTAGATAARAWYGENCTMPALGTSCSVPKSGLLDYAWHAVMGENSCYVTLEFGTRSLAALSSLLLEEAALWREAGVAPQRTWEMGERMRNHFYPDDESWREAVIFRARQVLGRALAGVSAP